MTPQEFIDKWSRADRTERQAAQEHFIDLCRVLGEPTPNKEDWHPGGLAHIAQEESNHAAFSRAISVSNSNRSCRASSSGNQPAMCGKIVR